MKKSRKLPARRGVGKGGNSGTTGISPGKGHNSRPKSQQARKTLIRDTYKRLAALEGERKALGRKITAEKQKVVKGDLGMTIKAFNSAVALFNLEGAERDAAMATVQEVFGAFDAGEQLDFFQASERHAKATTEPVDEVAEARAAARGPVGDTPRPTA